MYVSTVHTYTLLYSLYSLYSLYLLHIPSRHSLAPRPHTPLIFHHLYFPHY